MPLPVFYVGEANRRVTDTIKVLNGVSGQYEPWQIPDGATLKFRMWTENGSAPPRVGTATIVTPQGASPGQLYYDLTANDLARSGVYVAAWELTLSGGEKDLVPFPEHIVIKRVKVAV